MMVNLVDCLVQRSPVKSTVEKVMPCVLENEEDGNLICHLPPYRERYSCLKTKVLRKGVEQPGIWSAILRNIVFPLYSIPDLRQLNREVADQDKFGALPLFLCCRNLVLFDSQCL